MPARSRACRAAPTSGEVVAVDLLPEGSPAANPAFDVTPARLVTGADHRARRVRRQRSRAALALSRTIAGGVNLPPAALATVGLGFTQIVGWGTTFLMPSVLGRHMEDALGIPSEIVFSGITVMFAVGAIAAPRIGRLIDRTGARYIMAAGSLVYALSLAALAFSQGPVTYLLCWAGLGVASTLALSTPSSIALAQVAGPGARRAIGMLAIIGGFASTVFWPLSGALDVAVGWRGTLLVYAAIHLLACAPIHLLVLPSRPPTHHLSAVGHARAERRADRDPLACLPAAVADALHRRLRVHRRHGPHDRDPARARPSRRLGGAAGLADRPGPGHHPPVRAAVRPPLLDHELRRGRLGRCCRSGWGWR